MDTLVLKIESEKKEFFLSLLKELSFVQLEESYTEEQELHHIKAIEESEEDIVNHRVISHEDIQQEMYLHFKFK
ncbi:MAG: hypothetical protein NW226_23040 [Microscillaceae bacterium]|nr:hypothetical protein [Microscillaceae bacterium]